MQHQPRFPWLAQPKRNFFFPLQTNATNGIESVWPFRPLSGKISGKVLLYPVSGEECNGEVCSVEKRTTARYRTVSKISSKIFVRGNIALPWNTTHVADLLWPVGDMSEYRNWTCHDTKTFRSRLLIVLPMHSAGGFTVLHSSPTSRRSKRRFSIHICLITPDLTPY